MSLSDIVRVTIPTMGNGTGRWYEPNFDTYRTVAFEREIMQKMIGFGTAYRDAFTGAFLGFLSNPGRYDIPIEPIVPRHCLNLFLWLETVPEVYREEMQSLEGDLWREFGMTKIATDAVYRVVDWLRVWIGSHIEPTTEREPRSVRFANAWFELGVRIAYDLGHISMYEAEKLIATGPTP